MNIENNIPRDTLIYTIYCPLLKYTLLSTTDVYTIVHYCPLLMCTLLSTTDVYTIVQCNVLYACYTWETRLYVYIITTLISMHNNA